MSGGRVGFERAEVQRFWNDDKLNFEVGDW